jgi:uncharacterized membrane protein YdbT with pleckstrin-like domain
MSYIENNLLDDESLIYRAYLHWVIFAKPLFWFILTVILYLSIPIYMQETGKELPAHLGKIVILVSAIVTFLTALSAYLRYISSEFGITNRRIIVKLGFIRRNTYENFLQKIESIQVHQTILGRLFGYGTVVIRGTGGSTEMYGLISVPLAFRKQAQEQIEKVL